MGTKMKGILKGLRYISQIFDDDDDKEPEMQIGHPTDVKHVAHIGWDGPSIDSPSWMKEFNSPQGSQSGPLNVNGEIQENPEIKWVSEDSNRRSSRAQNTPARGPKPSRHQSLPDGSLASESITRDPSTKPRHSRRHQSTGGTSKDSLDSTKPNGQDSSLGSESSQNPPRKSVRKKSKESVSGGSTRPSRSSRSKATTSSTYTSPFSDPGPGPGSLSVSNSNELCQTSSLKPLVQEEEKDRNGIS
uniref:CRIB domain-containing protein n=1 Tax=Davidia involucrata TaxID=16924 RepID=A0A5B7CCI2_DAVIN